jgi:2-keto-4-pentenoate hydratase
MAYRIQQAVFARQHPDGRRAGFKAGLTSSRAQTMLNTDHPASGYLLSSGQLNNGDTVDLTTYTLPFIEMELGYQVKAAIHSPINSLGEMRALVSHIYPVLELPDIGFDSIQQVQLNTFIAHNAAARQFMIGKALPIEQFEDPNAIVSQCYKNDELLAQANGADALGDQWEALRFLINQRIELGEIVQPEDILITGALGPMFPCSRGQYRIDYGRLGTLQLTIQ